MGAPRVRCPTCRRELVWNETSPWRPFCSERCRMVDLGAWFAEERRIPAEQEPAGEGQDPARAD